MRNNTVQIDQRAFNRGVDEVLQLKPLVRVALRLYSNLHGHAPQTVREEPVGKPTSSSLKK